MTDSWIPRATIVALDNPEGRTELARLATIAARTAIPQCDVEIFWDDLWMRRIGPHYFAEPDLFRRAEPKWQHWPGAAASFLRDVQDHWFYLYKPRPGDVIVDIGAGRGEDVLPFSQAVGPAGRVLAIEPHPITFRALEKFCEWNRLSNVTPIRCACYQETAALQIETTAAWQSNYVRTGEASTSSSPVPGVRFDDLCRQQEINRIDYLKMNIEGAERSALPGCRDSLARTRFVTVAAHDFRAARGEGEQFRTLQFVRDFLIEAGFSLTTRDGDARYWVPFHVHGSRVPTAPAVADEAQV